MSTETISVDKRVEELMGELYKLRHDHNVVAGLKTALEYKPKLESHPVIKYAFYEVLAFFLYYNNYFVDSFNVYKKLHYYSPNQKIIDTCDYNIHFPAMKIVGKYIHYNPDNVAKWTKYFNRDRSLEGEQLITITSTTCKRLDLFKNTMNSFLECCLDFDQFKIDKWLVVDDNSSQEDRDEMVKLYPFLTFLNKTPAQKGHARSINMMLRHVHTPYLFHLEDDWQFYYKDNFFTLLYSVLQEKDEYKQVLLNNMYGEIPDHEQLIGGFWNKTEGGLNYIVHEYTKTEEEKNAFNRKWQFKPNCAYWPHFSFRPGLSKVSLFRDLGEFNEDVWHFEMNYAHKYVDKGYKTCFLPGMVCKHIGKLTSDREGINAYVLNEEFQFYGEKKITYMKRLATYCVNLDRRTDRKELFEKTMINISMPITRFSAVDGYALTLTPQMYHLFDKNDYNYRKGIVGCALSHIRIWIQHYYSEASKQRDFLMVMEDDLYFPKDSELVKSDGTGFEEIVEKSLEYMDKQSLDLLFLQYTPRNPSAVRKDVTYRHVNANTALQFSFGGTGCYIITKKGIKKMLDFINKSSMTNAIDTVMQKSADHLNVAYLEPLIVVLDMNKEGDTDIQYNFDSCAKDTISLIKDEVKFLSTLDYTYERDYIISKFSFDSPRWSEVDYEYTYPLRDAHVLFKVKPSDKLVELRPYQRLVVDEGVYVYSI